LNGYFEHHGGQIGKLPNERALSREAEAPTRSAAAVKRIIRICFFMCFSPFWSFAPVDSHGAPEHGSRRARASEA
jgi:hypothetical protein